MSQQLDDTPDLSQETPPEDVFIPPSIDRTAILAGQSYTHFSPVPAILLQDASTECVLGVDEAGRGPVLGPMVYGLAYLPRSVEKSLLTETYHFDDSKALTPAVRSHLMQTLCTSSSDLWSACGWATRVMSARDISAGMLQASGAYNLNAQAMDATINLIHEVFAKGVNVKEIYIDTIGSPIVYQKKLEKIFPTTQITVAKKADSLYPCVSAASICAKVTRDAALEVSYESYKVERVVESEDIPSFVAEGWGSGYPSDSRSVTWLKKNMDPVFGWGSECRFSWGTAKELLEAKSAPVKIDWPEEDDDEDTIKVTSYFNGGPTSQDPDDTLMNWFGVRVTEKTFQNTIFAS